MKNDFEEQYPVSQKIMRFTGEAIRDYSMIRENDSIMIGLSGGKDSLLLSLALAVLKKRSPVNFTLKACLIDQSGGSMETGPVLEYMDRLGIETTLLKHSTYDIVREREERSPCSFCANMRRGILATQARCAGCGVIALGHHKDDAAETVLLNLCYGGRFKCFHPHMLMSRSGVRVIRPLIYVDERRIILEAERLGLPIASSCCPYGYKSKRKTIKELVAEIEKEYPDLKSNILHALKNVSEKEVWREKLLNG